MNSRSLQTQRGAALIVGLIMLVLITVMLLSALVLSTSGFRSVANMQFRDEAIAAANRAINEVISSDFTLDPTGAAENVNVDIDDDNGTDYVVQIEVPQCVSAAQAFSADPSSLSLPVSMTVAPTWNTVWDIRAVVAPTGNAGGAAVVVRAGVRALVTDAQKTTSCG